MKWYKRAICWTVSRTLGYIPRYGRVYSLNEDLYVVEKRWHFFRRGFWDITLLSRLGLLFEYFDYLESKQRCAATSDTP